MSFAITSTMFAASIAVFGAGNGLADTGDPIIASKKLLADPVSPNGSKITSGKIDGRNLTLQVYSAAMSRNITVKVQRPSNASAPRPVLYLVNGAGGGTDAATWWAKLWRRRGHSELRRRLDQDCPAPDGQGRSITRRSRPH